MIHTDEDCEGLERV
jgi:hypothetical protein